MQTHRRTVLPFLCLLLAAVSLLIGCGRDLSIPEEVQPAEALDTSYFGDHLLAFCYQSGVQDSLGRQRTDLVIQNLSNTRIISLPATDTGSFRNLGCFLNGGPMFHGDYALEWENNSETLVTIGGFDYFTSDIYLITLSDESSLEAEIEKDSKFVADDQGFLNLGFVNPRSINAGSQSKRYLIVGFNALGTRYQNVWIYYPTRNGRSVQLTDFAEIGLPFSSASWSPTETHVIVYGSHEYSGFEIYNVEDDTNVFLVKTLRFADQAGLSEWPFRGFISFGPVGLREILNDGSTPVWLNEDQVLFLAPTPERELTGFVYDIDYDVFTRFDERLTGINGLFELSPDGSKLVFVHYGSWGRNDRAAIQLYDLLAKEITTVAVLPSNNGSPVYVTGLNWSPDGDYIAFSSNHMGESDIYVVNAGGTAWINLTEDLDGDAVYPVWRP